ncbi:hypothetical protein O6H91_16G023200 [Diphasiastrum complanatum]|uniref:Uncharacterized protein n=1 Tax=Diphasiastrum complanatum TaxID=34168 RepID=A0ACC2BAM1_DIPCM|nr:hypothetical protein O6H91_16G023200 [Diphasiastrum complanatum]
MAPGGALSDGFLVPGAFVGVEMRRELRPSAHRRCCYTSWVACAAKSRSGMFLRPPDQCRSLQSSKFSVADQSQRKPPVVVSMCKDEAEITAAQELADGSIFFSFGEKPIAQNAKNVEEMSLSPTEHSVVARVHLPNRWPSQFKKQLPYPVLSGIQESAGVGNSAESPSQGLKMPPRATDETESGKKGFTPIRLPSKFVKKSPISLVAEIKAHIGNKYPETANKEIARKAGHTCSRFFSKFVRQSPIPASLVGPLAAFPSNKSNASRSRSSKSAMVILEDLKSMHGAKEIDSIHSKSYSQSMISGKGTNWKLDSDTHNQDQSPADVVMADSKIGLELKAGGFKKNDHLISKAKVTSRRVDKNVHHVSDELTRPNSFAKMSIPPQVDRHAPTRLPSKFVRISPIPSAGGPKDVQACSRETQQSHVGTKKDSAKVAFLESSKKNKKTVMHDNGKGKTTKDIPKVEEIKLDWSSSSIATSSSDNHKSHHDYSQYTVPELKMLAKSLNLKGYSKLRKQELLELLQSAYQ